MFPYAAIGVFLDRNRILYQCRKKRFLSLSVLMILGCIVIVCNKYAIIKNPGTGYNYQGINLALISVILVMAFYLLPFDQMNDALCNLICNVSQYSLGVYAVHILIGQVMDTVFEKKAIVCNSFFQCILIFIISLLLSCMISRLPFKWCKKIVV